MRTRTADLYRVKATSLCTYNNLESVEDCLSTRKARPKLKIVTGEITGKNFESRTLRRVKAPTPRNQQGIGHLANHVWSYDFVRGKTHDGRTLRMLTLIDEYTRECLAIRVARRLSSYEVIEALADVMLWRGIPEHIRSDNGPEFVAKELRKWLANVGTGTLYIEPGSPWENGYCESFNGKLRDECLS